LPANGPRVWKQGKDDNGALNEVGKAMLKPFLTFISGSLPVDYHSIRRTKYR
jgi:hypothetical protein